MTALQPYGSPALAGVRFDIPLTPPPAAPKRPYEICQLLTDYRPALFKPGMAAEEKIDGIRAIWKGGKLVTRTGVPIECSRHIWPELRRLEEALGWAFIIDGEYQEPEGYDSTLNAFNAGGPGSGRGIFHAFDAVRVAEWVIHTNGEPLTARRARLERAMAETTQKALPPPIRGIMGQPTPHQGNYVRLIEQRTVRSEAEAMAIAEEVWRLGGEGVVLKDPNAPYQCARSTAWLRIKRKIALVCPVVDVVESKAGGSLAALVVEFRGRRVRVGSGFGPADRENMWRQRHFVIGRNAQVEAMEITARGLRQAVFKGWSE